MSIHHKVVRQQNQTKSVIYWTFKIQFDLTNHNVLKIPNFPHLAQTGQSHLEEAEMRLISHQGFQIWHPNRVILAQIATNLGLFNINFSTFWLAVPKCTEIDLKKVPDLFHLGPIRHNMDAKFDISGGGMRQEEGGRVS